MLQHDERNEAGGAFGAICLASFLACALSCGGFTDYSAPLVNGYSLIEVNADTVMIAPDGGWSNGEAVEPKVVELAISGDFIVGRCEAGSHTSVPAVPGYFFLDTRAKKCTQGLSAEAYAELLRRNGIPPDVQLRSTWSYNNSPAKKFWTAVGFSVIGAIAVCAMFVFVRLLKRRRRALPFIAESD